MTTETKSPWGAGDGHEGAVGEAATLLDPFDKPLADFDRSMDRVKALVREALSIARRDDASGPALNTPEAAAMVAMGIAVVVAPVWKAAAAQLVRDLAEIAKQAS